MRGTAETRLIPHWNDSKLASSEADEPLGSFFGLESDGDCWTCRGQGQRGTGAVHDGWPTLRIPPLIGLALGGLAFADRAPSRISDPFQGELQAVPVQVAELIDQMPTHRRRVHRPGLPTRARVALVTGASKGIGRAIAAGLLRESLVVYLGARDADRGTAAAAELAGLGDVRYIQLGVTSPESVTAAAARVGADFGYRRLGEQRRGQHRQRPPHRPHSRADRGNP